jgi:hypothetical protein
MIIFRVAEPVTRIAAGAIARYRIVRATDTDNTVAQAAAATAKLIGVTGIEGATEAGKRVPVEHWGIVPVEYGDDTIVFGDPLTADADGKAVVASPGDMIIGFANEGGDENTIGSVLIAPGQLSVEAASP